MSAPLVDVRCKITAEADCVLEAVARTTGRDRSEIIRDWLHERALTHIAEARLLDKLLRSEGLRGIERERERIAGNRRAHGDHGGGE